MCVLRVVHGVLIALRDSQLQVELDRRVWRSQEIEVADGVRSHTIDELVERDEATRPLAHLAFFEIDHLMKDDHELLRVEAERGRGGLHTGHVAVVVRGPHLDHAVEAALLEAAQEVAKVAGKVGRLAVGPNDNAVLFFVVRLAKPKRSVALLDVS